MWYKVEIDYLRPQKTGSRFKRILVRLKHWTRSNKMLFISEKKRFCTLCRKNQMHRYNIGGLAVYYWKGSWFPGRPQIKYKPALHCSCQKNQFNLGLNQQTYNIKIRGSDSSSLYCAGQIASGILQLQGGNWRPGRCTEKNNKESEGFKGKSYEKFKKNWAFSARKSWEKTYNSLPILEGPS